MRHRCKQKGEKVEVKHDNMTRELQNKTGNKKNKNKTMAKCRIWCSLGTQHAQCLSWGSRRKQNRDKRGATTRCSVNIKLKLKVKHVWIRGKG